MKKSPLDPMHARLGARMEKTDGWSMPHSFSSLLEEHLAARSACAVFDVSHMSKFRIRGNGALEWLESVLSRKMADCRDGESRHALLQDAEGKVLDRVALLRESAGNFLLLGHAALEEQDAAWLEAHKPHAALEMRNETNDWCALVLMGPQCEQVLARVLRGVELPGMGSFHHFLYQNHELILARIGLHEETEQERAYEFFCPAVAGISWFESFLGAGAQPCGQATRECLRLERGCVAMGKDSMPARHTPEQLGLDSLCHAGKTPLHPREKIARLRCEQSSHATPEPGSSVRDSSGATVGKITSASYSPALEGVVAMALISAPLVHPGMRLVIMMQGKEVPAQVM